MKTTLLSTLSLAAVATLAIPENARCQDDGAKDPAAEMAAYLELIKPGPEHQKLRELAGDWTTVQKLWMAPGAPPQENKGTAKFRMILGGRYLLQTYSSEIGGMGKFQGRGTTAFDKVEGEYVQTWFDSFSTGIMISRGKPADGDKLEMTGEARDAFTKAMVTFRQVSTFVDKDTHKFEFFETKGDAEERKFMEITYTRTADAPGKKAGGEKEK